MEYKEQPSALKIEVNFSNPKLFETTKKKELTCYSLTNVVNKWKNCSQLFLYVAI